MPDLTLTVPVYLDLDPGCAVLVKSSAAKQPAGRLHVVSGDERLFSFRLHQTPEGSTWQRVGLPSGWTMVLSGKLAPGGETAYFTNSTWATAGSGTTLAYTATLDFAVSDETWGDPAQPSRLFFMDLEIRDATNTVRGTWQFELELHRENYGSGDTPDDPDEPFLDRAAADNIYLSFAAAQTLTDPNKLQAWQNLGGTTFTLGLISTADAAAFRTAIGAGTSSFDPASPAALGTATPNAATFTALTATGATTVGGTLVVTGTATAATPTASTHLTTKGYVDTTASTPAPPLLVAWDTGSAIYIRMAWDATYDLVVKAVRNSGTNNANLNFQELGILLKTTPSTGTPTLTIIETFSDDTTGYLTAANGRIGGNHCAETVELTKAAHGITSASIGKRYQDTNARKYAITRIISSSVIEVIPEPALSVLDPTGTKTLPPAASTLTGLDGLSNLTGWTAGYAAAGPGILGLVQYVYLDDRPLIPFAPAQTGARLQITEYSQAPNLKGAFTYFVATGSTATWAAAGKMWDRITTTTFHPWGQMEVEDSALIAYETRFTEANPLQFNPLLGLTGATNMHVWIPGADTITASGATINGSASPSLNFNVPTYIGGTCSGSDVQLETSGDSILSGGVFPDFVVQLTSASSGSHSGWTVGHLAALDPTYAGGVPATRSTNAKEWFRLAPSSRKTYAPQLMSKDSTFAAGTAFAHRAMRRWIPAPAPASSPVDFWTFSKAGEKWLIHAAWTTNPGAFTLTLPSYLANLPTTAVRIHNSALTSTNTAGSQLTITPSAANGHAIIQLG